MGFSDRRIFCHDRKVNSCTEGAIHADRQFMTEDLFIPIKMNCACAHELASP